MAEPRGKKAVDVVEEVTGDRGPVEASTEEFNQHIKNLVALYADDILKELEQRVSDLEMLATQPQGAVSFLPPPQVAVPYAPTEGEGSVPWFQPDH